VKKHIDGEKKRGIKRKTTFRVLRGGEHRKSKKKRGRSSPVKKPKGALEKTLVTEFKNKKKKKRKGMRKHRSKLRFSLIKGKRRSERRVRGGRPLGKMGKLVKGRSGPQKEKGRRKKNHKKTWRLKRGPRKKKKQTQ